LRQALGVTAGRLRRWGQGRGLALLAGRLLLSAVFWSAVAFRSGGCPPWPTTVEPAQERDE
jgi:hypothetical protein